VNPNGEAARERAFAESLFAFAIGISIEDAQLCHIMGRHLEVVNYNFAVDTAAPKRHHE
jgi:hypothetical protein